MVKKQGNYKIVIDEFKKKLQLNKLMPEERQVLGIANNQQREQQYSYA